MESVAGVRKPIKAGSSDVITVTKDLQSLGLETGDEVCFWLSKNTPENDRILRIVTLSESGEYDIMNGLWLKLQSKNEYDDPSKYLDEESIAVVDDLETIQSSTTPTSSVPSCALSSASEREATTPPEPTVTSSATSCWSSSSSSHCSRGST